MKLLNGLELAGYIKEQQLHQSRALRQAEGVTPRLAIVRANPDPVVDSYMKLKRAYGADLEAEVNVHTVEQSTVLSLLAELNADPSIHGIIVQLPLPDLSQTEEILNTVSLTKDVDGLAANSSFTPATPLSIHWLLAGYNIELKGKNIVIVGQGRLVGKPLAELWRSIGIAVQTADKHTTDLAALTREADIIVSATGIPRLITADMIKPNAVIVDAGVATDKNGLVGDVDPAVREMDGITITPEKGGVGPLTVCALFENVLQAARAAAKSVNAEA